MKTIHQRYCSRCHVTNTPLMKAQKGKPSKKGIVRQYYMCRSCNTARMKKWYHALTPEKKKRYSLRCNAWIKSPNGIKYLAKKRREAQKARMLALAVK